MAAVLADVPGELFQALDTLDFDAIRALMSEGVEGVDEISRRWLRGRDALDTYMRQLEEMGIGSLDSRLSDVHVREWGDVGVVTLWLDQRYQLGEIPNEIHSPTTIVCRRRGGEWKIELVHSVPLGEEG